LDTNWFGTAAAKTWAFEPNSVTYTLLVDNLELNWFFEGVVTEQKAVYSESVEINFCAPERHNVNATIADFPDGHRPRVADRHDRMSVHAVALDDYFKPDVPTLDFLKVAVEGAELFVLKGAGRNLAKNRDAPKDDNAAFKPYGLTRTHKYGKAHEGTRGKQRVAFPGGIGHLVALCSQKPDVF
jgi:FkbM family methyltransferase